MHIVKGIVIAFSIYSKIPVPQFPWEEEDMKYMLCFFPWVGVIIGLGIYLWNCLCVWFKAGNLCRSLGMAALPLIITGGFHVDGFMDTMDAIHSYGSRERKLEILKDSHIGAFAVIMLIAYGLVVFGAFSEIEDKELLKIVCSGFFLSRCLCGISAVSFPLAKREGTLFLFADSSHKKLVKAFLYLQSMACIGFMIRCSFFAGMIVAATALFALSYYFYHSRKEFGGITGDTAGYFVLLCEGCMIIAAAFIEVFM